MSRGRFLGKAYRSWFPDLRTNGGGTGKAEREDPRGQAFDVAAHFRDHGRAENRHLAEPLTGAADVVLVSANGTLLVSGWLDDTFQRRSLLEARLPKLVLRMSWHEVDVPPSAILRTGRADVTTARGLLEEARLGFLVLMRLPEDVPPSDRLAIGVRHETNVTPLTEVVPRIVSEGYLVSYYLGFFHGLEREPHHPAAAIKAHARHGGALGALWQAHLAGAAGHTVLDLRSRDPGRGVAGTPAFSAITVVHGQVDLLHRQCVTQFPALAALGGEILVVSNHPPFHAQVQELCRYAHAAFDVPVRVLAMDGNVGFSRANNLAAGHAGSDRLVFENPDVFPFAKTDWPAFARRIAALGDDEIVGGHLYFPDGTVMHAGMVVESDPMPVRVRPGRGAGPDADGALPDPLPTGALLREDHPHKGAHDARFAGLGAPRPFPAVTGSLILVRRALFDALGGFSTDYVFGCYEDADLCLRARAAGASVTCDPGLRLVHLEGGGGGEKLPAVRGAMLYNRILFTARNAGRLPG